MKRHYEKIGNQKENKSKWNLLQFAKLSAVVTICSLLFSTLPNSSTSIPLPVKHTYDSSLHQPVMKNKIAILIVYSGKQLPDYSDVFLNSVQNKSIDVLFVSMSGVSLLSKKYQNIKQIKLHTNFYALTAARLCKAYGGCSVQEASNLSFLIQMRLKKPYLVCELRPMFSYIFADYLTDYEYVGWGDMDIVWGDVNTLNLYLEFDVISVSFGDIDRLYLRGQFTIFRNELALSLSFVDAIPKDKLMMNLLNPNMIPEEGLYSKYMIGSNYTILILPFQRSSWDCAKNVILNGTELECDEAEPITKLLKIPIGPAQSRIAISKKNSKNCSTHWVQEEYRTCIHAVSFGFIIILNNIAFLHPVSEQEHKSIARYPLFYHFQIEKNKFAFKTIV